MSQPPGYVDAIHHYFVCHLKKTLYGLPQAPKVWYDHWGSRSLSLFVIHNMGVTIYILIYMDDLIITSSDETLVHHVVTSLSKEFSHKYLGLLHYILGVKVHRDADGLFLNQSKYIPEILHDTQMQVYKDNQSSTSMSKRLLVNAGEPKTDSKEYKSVLVKLQYLLFI